MEEEQEQDDTPTWDDATRGSGRYIRFEEKTPKRLVLGNWRLENLEKFGKIKVCFVADVLKEDDTDYGLEPKLLESSSSRLNKELRPFFEGKKFDDIVSVEVTVIGTSFDTQYLVRGI